MKEKSKNNNTSGNRRDYRPMILLVAGLLVGFSAFVDQAMQIRKTDPQTSSLPMPRAEFLLPGTLSDEMRPFVFLPVRINSADGRLLETIPGIGPALAERIIALRTARKGFHDLTELLEVEGIGPRKFAGLQGFCSL
ncbi:MAG: helix-hairpin-helix domain-containing protein [Deltaproteobacteria bacterium]|nr:helix-hairpin-helix domain-containing protein [Deltaproteobacteria bacterium]